MGYDCVLSNQRSEFRWLKIFNAKTCLRHSNNSVWTAQKRKLNNWKNCIENVTLMQWNYQGCTIVKVILAKNALLCRQKKWKKMKFQVDYVFTIVLSYPKTIEIIGWQQTQMHLSWVHQVQSDWFFTNRFLIPCSNHFVWLIVIILFALLKNEKYSLFDMNN